MRLASASLAGWRSASIMLMRILICNDDGILAPGIAALYRAVADMGRVDVVAPETSQSAMGHAITVLSPMLVQRVHVNNLFHGWSVDGRPADCVKLAILELMDARPDFVLSGINSGSNTSINVLYSGTVAGAIEAAFFGIPSIAFSLELSAELDFARAGVIARQIFERFAAARPAPGVCLNVNIPALDRGWPVGVQVCSQAVAAMRDKHIRQTDAQGRTIYWLDGRMPDAEEHPESDLSAMRERKIAITPLRFDMTDHARLTDVAGWGWPQTFDDQASRGAVQGATP